MPEKPLIIYAVSDLTGDLSVNMAIAAVRQFRKLEPDVRRRARVDSPEKIKEIVDEAKAEGALILYTLVSSVFRHVLMEEAQGQGVRAIDLIGPVLETIAEKAGLEPSDQPGLQYKNRGHYLKKAETMTFTVKHDDGQGLETLDEADIIILGISRTSKTPLAIYLAYRGFKVANIPIVKGVDIPRELFKVDQRKLIALTIDQEKMVRLRSSRLQKLGRSLSEDYANPEYVNEEIAYQKKISAELGNIPIINITNKAIEEAATEILTILGR